MKGTCGFYIFPFVFGDLFLWLYICGMFVSEESCVRVIFFFCFSTGMAVSFNCVFFVFLCILAFFLFPLFFGKRHFLCLLVGLALYEKYLFCCSGVGWGVRGGVRMDILFICPSWQAKIGRMT